MRKYTYAYLIWLAGVLSFAAVAYAYYRRIEKMAPAAAVAELRTTRPDPED